MATRNDVETAIAAIENGGNNTAKEVRDVLTFLLDYTENKESESDVKPFHFNNNGEPVKDGSRAILLYSFKGLIKQTVNFTFKLLATTNNNGNLTFKLEASLIPVLAEIMQTQSINFIVPLFRLNTATTHVATNVTTGVPLNLILKGSELHMTFHNVPMKKGDAIFTSVQFHVPKSFDLG